MDNLAAGDSGLEPVVQDDGQECQFFGTVGGSTEATPVTTAPRVSQLTSPIPGAGRGTSSISGAGRRNLFWYGYWAANYVPAQDTPTLRLLSEFQAESDAFETEFKRDNPSFGEFNVDYFTCSMVSFSDD